MTIWTFLGIKKLNASAIASDKLEYKELNTISKHSLEDKKCSMYKQALPYMLPTESNEHKTVNNHLTFKYS